MRRWARVLRGLLRGEAGTATVEFVLLFPLFLMVMVNAIEASMLMTRATMLDRGLDLAVRDLRLGTGGIPNAVAFGEAVCGHAGLGGACADGLRVELVSADLASRPWKLIDTSGDCAADGAVWNTTGAGNDLMMVRACLDVDAIVPNPWLNALLRGNGSGGFRLTAVSAYVHEPSATVLGS